MKLNKLLAVLVSASGILITTSVSYSLYTLKAPDQSFDITVAEPIKLPKVALTPNGYHTFKGDYVTDSESTPRTVKYRTTLECLNNNQNYQPGNLSISLTGAGASNYNISAHILGYTPNTYGAATYGGDNLFNFVDNEASSDLTVCTGKNNTNQTLEVTLTLKDGVQSFTDDCQVNVNWGESKSTNYYPYVKGDKNSWAKSDTYRLAEYIDSIHLDKTQWVFNELEGFTELKINQKYNYLKFGDPFNADNYKPDHGFKRNAGNYMYFDLANWSPSGAIFKADFKQDGSTTSIDLVNVSGGLYRTSSEIDLHSYSLIDLKRCNATNHDEVWNRMNNIGFEKWIGADDEKQSNIATDAAKKYEVYYFDSYTKGMRQSTNNNINYISNDY